MERFTFFYGKFSPFSQFHSCSFEIDGITYSCAEQYMMHQKAVIFCDHEMANAILNTTDPLQMKKYGRKVTPFNPIHWSKVCMDVVYQGNLAKFSQNPHLKEALLSTIGTTLAEASPRDTIWGIGLGNTPKAHDRNNWRGKNLLGEVLMRVREELQKNN